MQNEIFNEYFGLAKMTARQYFKNELDVEAAALVALEKLFKKFPDLTLEELKENGGYIYRLIRNACISELRKSQTVSKRNILSDDFSRVKNLFEDMSIEEDDIRYSKIEREIQKLSDREKRILQLKFEEGYSYKEISQVLNVNPNNIGTLYSRLLKKLREKLAG